MDIWLRAGSMAIGYLFGMILTAEIVSGIFAGKSAGEVGTGNPGMANIMANIGRKAGFLVLAGYILKTAAAMGIVSLYSGESRMFVWYAGLGAVLGHNFPVWKGGRGGKGVTCTCTWLILSMGLLGVLCCLSGAAAVLAVGYLPLGAVILSLVSIPVAFCRFGAEAGFLACVGAILMISRHKHGLVRILKGKEKKVFRKRRSGS